VFNNPSLDQNLDDSDIERLEDHFEVKDVTLGPPMSFDFHISTHWPFLGPFPSSFRGVGLYVGYATLDGLWIHIITPLLDH